MQQLDDIEPVKLIENPTLAIEHTIVAAGKEIQKAEVGLKEAHGNVEVEQQNLRELQRRLEEKVAAVARAEVGVVLATQTLETAREGLATVQDLGKTNPAALLQKIETAFLEKLPIAIREFHLPASESSMSLELAGAYLVVAIIRLCPAEAEYNSTEANYDSVFAAYDALADRCMKLKREYSGHDRCALSISEIKRYIKKACEMGFLDPKREQEYVSHPLIRHAIISQAE